MARFQTRCLKIFVLFIVFCACDAAADENIIKKNAFELYTEANLLYENLADIQQKNNKDKYEKYEVLEAKLMEAINLVPNDTGDLKWSFAEQRLVPGKGRYIEYETVSIPFNEKYYPNRLLSKIRNEASPEAWAVINFLSDKKKDGSVISVKIKNSGVTSLEKIGLNTNISYFHGSDKQIEILKPGQSEILKLNPAYPGGCLKELSLSFSEKFHYSPCPMNIKANKFAKLISKNISKQKRKQNNGNSKETFSDQHNEFYQLLK